MTGVHVQTYLGEEITGATWGDILTHLKLTNYSNPQDLEELMTRLKMRVKTFTGEVIAVGTHRDFGHELARIGFLKILHEETLDDDFGGNTPTGSTHTPSDAGCD